MWQRFFFCDISQTGKSAVENEWSGDEHRSRLPTLRRRLESLPYISMTEPLSKIPAGMRYFSGAEARLRREIEAAIISIFAGWSYEEITTPTIDYYSLFEHGMGHSQAHRAFRFSDTHGRLLDIR